MTLHIFNPEHDLALAANITSFTPPHAARQLRSELSFLPALWAEDGDIVIVDDIVAAQNAYRKLKLRHRSEVVFDTLEDIKCMFPHEFPFTIRPWGWDMTVRQALLNAGVSEALMPTQNALDTIRALSNRCLAVALLARLECFDRVTGFARICHNSEDVMRFLDEYKDIVVKAPWSCSGRGVRYITRDTFNVNLQQWVSNTIKHQKSVVAEVKCSKVMDFAVEFWAGTDGSVKAVGLSLFNTVNGAYTGNMLDAEKDKRAFIRRYLPLEVLDRVVVEIERFLSYRIRGVYTGPLGVDMMIVSGNAECNSGQEPAFLLNPCIEINFRCTMGHAALALSNRGHKGTMDIVFENKSYKVKLGGGV